MAYVKLPEELRSWEILLPDGGASRFEFSIFAGETVKLQQRSGGGGASLTIRSRRGERRFDFSQMPVKFKEGDVAGVLAVLPENEEDGPILCVANLDSDLRCDFLSREPELLRLMTNDSVDLRGASLGWGAMAGDLFRGLGIGVLAAVIAAAVLAGMSVGGDFVSRWVSNLLGGTTPLLVGAVGAVAGFGLLMTLGTMRLSRSARFQRQLLEHVWTRAGEALGFVQENIEAFRFSAIIAEGGSAPEEPKAVIGEPVEEKTKPVSLARDGAEDAELLPMAAEPAAPRQRRVEAEDGPSPRRQAPRMPGGTWRRTQASDAAAHRRAEEVRAEAPRSACDAQPKHAARPRGEAARQWRASGSTKYVASVRDSLDSAIPKKDTVEERFGRLAQGLRASGRSGAAAPEGASKGRSTSSGDSRG